MYVYDIVFNQLVCTGSYSEQRPNNFKNDKRFLRWFEKD